MADLLDMIHPFKRQQIARVAADSELKSRCAELWVFGSTVKGASDKQHTVFSDVDFGILPQNSTSSLDDPVCRAIDSHLMNDLTVDGRFTEYDIVWLNRNPTPAMLASVHRGTRVF